MQKAPYECDLHSHTNNSDGNDTYAEIIDSALRRGLKVIAICDHDVVPLKTVDIGIGDAPDGLVPLREYAVSKGICVIPGIELSCNTDVEDVHIVGLGCDFDDPRFAALQEEIAESKVESYRELCRRLTRAGMPVDWEEVLGIGGRRVDEREVQKKQVFETMAKKGYAPDWSKAKLMVKNTPDFQTKRQKPDADAMIRLVKETGGLAILAHPYLIDEPLPFDGRKISRAEYIDTLIGAGLDGIEAAYPYDKTSYKGGQTPDEIEALVQKAYAGRLAVISGGSDYHHDAKKGVQNQRELGEKGVSLAYMRANPLLARLLY